MMTSEIFGPVSPFGDDFLEGSTFEGSLAYLRAKEEMLNDRSTARFIGGKASESHRLSPIDFRA